MGTDLMSENENLIETYRKENKFKKIVLAYAKVVIYVILSVLIITAVSLVSHYFFQILDWKISEQADMILMEIQMLLGALIVTWMMLKFDKHSVGSLGFSLKGRWKDILVGFLCASAIYAVGFSVSLSLGLVEVVGFHPSVSTILNGFILFAIVAVFEELICRGYMLSTLMGAVNRYVALVSVALIFSAMHLGNDNVEILPLINIVIAGILLGSAYIFTRNLWFAISLHFFWNFIQGTILGYPVSGGDFVTCVTLKISGNPLLSGGEFGFEGSLICTAVSLIAVAVIIGCYRKKGYGITSVSLER